MCYPPSETFDIDGLHETSGAAMLRVRMRRHVTPAAALAPFVPGVAAQKAQSLQHVIVGETVRCFHSLSITLLLVCTHHY
jgi:hypothetical protein